MVAREKKGKKGIKIEYSIDGLGAWHTVYNENDVFMRQSTDGGRNWSAPIRIKGEPGKPIVTPDATKSLLYFSCTDVTGEYVINNAKKNSFGKLTGGKQVQGISGQALEFDAGQGVNFSALSGMTSCSISVFFKLKTHGVIMQQCNKALKIKTAQDKLIIYPDPAKELTVNTPIALDTWYCVIYSYDDSAHTETVRLYEYSKNTGRYVISDRKKWDFDNTARDFTTAWNETIEQDGEEATGTVDEIRIDGYCWNDEECEGWTLLKGGTGRMYTAGDYKLSNVEKIVQDAAPRYLGKFTQDPNKIARNGDWYAYSGETTAERIKGRCYRRVSSSLWVVVDSWQENIAAMSDLLSIADDTINESLPAGEFTSVLAACDVFAKRLIANEAFINKLATNEAFIDKLVTKKLLVDSDTANPNNFELAINESTGISAKKENNILFEVRPDGQICLGNALYSSGKFKADRQTRSFASDEKLQGLTMFIGFALKNGFKTSGVVNKINFDDIKMAENKTLIKEYTVKSRQPIGYGKEWTYECIDWSVKEYQKTKNLSFFYNQKQIFAKVYTGRSKEVLQISKVYKEYGRKYEDVQIPTGYDFSPTIDFNTTVTSIQMAVTLKLFNVPLFTGQNFEPGTIFRDDTGTLHIAF